MFSRRRTSRGAGPLSPSQRVRLRVRASGQPAVLFERAARSGGNGEVEESFPAPLRAGAYRVTVALDGQDEALAEEYFVVEEGGDELARPRSQSAPLRALAEATGGRFVERPEDAPELSAFESTQIRRLGARVTRPFGSVWMFAFVLILISSEWLLRRRWGKR